jgi:hypothetical protein
MTVRSLPLVACDEATAAGADRNLGWQTTEVSQIAASRSAVDERFLSSSALDVDRQASGRLIEKDEERSEDQAVVEKSDLAGLELA